MKKILKPYLGNQDRLDKMKSFIENYWRDKHYSPSSAEICVALGEKGSPLSTSVVDYYRLRLEREGWLEKRPGLHVARSYVPIEIFKDRPVFPNDSPESGLFDNSLMVEFERE